MLPGEWEESRHSSLRAFGAAGPHTLDGAEWPGELWPAVSAALDSPRAGSLIFAANLRLLHATGKVGPLLGLAREQLMRGCDVLHSLRTSTALNRESLAILEARLARAVQNPEADEGTISLSNADGTRLITAETRRLARQCWMSIFEDVTMRRETESHLLNLALRDPLTGLGSRIRFERSVTAALEASPDRAAAILLVDLDRFKAVNDTLGHPVGDGVLRLVAQRLQSAVGDSGVSARLGGDEFAVVISPAQTPAELADLAGRIIGLLQRTFLVSGNVVNIGASVGIAVAPKDGDSLEALLKSADLALYHSKATGRGRFHFFDRAMEERALERRTLELDLRKALPLRQLEVHYQPQVDTASKTLLGFEATLRWRNPKRGLMEPEEFTPLVEELGLTVQIGDWMLLTACRQAAKWPGALKVSVGAAWPQFESGRFAESVTRALKAASLPGSQLEIEINESVLLRNEQSVFATLHDLRAVGVQVAMDDFGTGYASLSQLASFPFDRVNINRSLLVDEAGNSKHRAIVRAIAALGASLGIATMGEGIETAAELARIHSDGCSFVQGYLSTTAIPASDVQQLIARSLSPGKVPSRFEEEEHEHQHLQTCLLQP